MTPSLHTFMKIDVTSENGTQKPKNTSVPPLRGQFLYPENGQKQTFFDPSHLVQLLNDPKHDTAILVE